MSKHSLGAYRIVIKMRSVKTLLVEGDDDKVVMQRLVHEFGRDNDHEWCAVIDTPSLLTGESLSGLGNRAKVELIASECGAQSADKFVALIDREWDDFDSDSLSARVLADDDFVPERQVVKTFGHSIENYFIGSEIFSSLLRRNFPGGLSPPQLRTIDTHFFESCVFALAYSIAARRLQIISRLGGALKRNHLSFAEFSYQLDHTFEAVLLARGVGADSATAFAEDVSRLQTEIRERALLLEELKWACHGHLGLEAIWACIAKTVETLGCDSDLCERVQSGIKVEKLLHGADMLAAGVIERRPLERLARWMTSPLVAV